MTPKRFTNEGSVMDGTPSRLETLRPGWDWDQSAEDEQLRNPTMDGGSSRG